MRFFLKSYTNEDQLYFQRIDFEIVDHNDESENERDIYYNDEEEDDSMPLASLPDIAYSNKKEKRNSMDFEHCNHDKCVVLRN